MASDEVREWTTQAEEFLCSDSDVVREVNGEVERRVQQWRRFQREVDGEGKGA